MRANTDSVKPLCLWSGPRNVSTALMYSFAQLDGIRVIDEPLYGHYLRVTGADHPGRDDIVAAMNCDGDAVVREMLDEQRARPSPRLFCKHMAHHLVDIDLSFLANTRNLFLIRDPREMLPSLTIQVPHARLTDTSLEQQWLMYSDMLDAGEQAVIIDSKEILLDPAGILSQACESIGVDYSNSMLNWPAGPREEDGVWAPHWYHAVHKSTGFQPYTPKEGFPDHLRSLLDECQPYYDRLYEHALRANAAGD